MYYIMPRPSFSLITAPLGFLFLGPELQHFVVLAELRGPQFGSLRFKEAPPGCPVTSEGE